LKSTKLLLDTGEEPEVRMDEEGERRVLQYSKGGVNGGIRIKVGHRGAIIGKKNIRGHKRKE